MLTRNFAYILRKLSAMPEAEASAIKLQELYLINLGDDLQKECVVLKSHES